ncbi:hypothetical protein [Anaerobacillus arseniciselenatis]|uniref:hypothetical protein n=1 Tax=Anaerobacillus arseniciselenatis TaxID=85682 RepID=UPI001470DFD2|nr:hypothetical protein [Anaerobacillus arseniciselenatis]
MSKLHGKVASVDEKVDVVNEKVDFIYEDQRSIKEILGDHEVAIRSLRRRAV